MKRLFLLLLCFPLFLNCGEKAQSQDRFSWQLVSVELNQKLDFSPHLFDVYRPDQPSKAIIFLHGGMGTKELSARNLGINLRRRILTQNNLMVVCPQGQIKQGRAYTWSNHAMDSGQDDLQFLRDLVQHIRFEYNVEKLCLAGHSMGGVMVNRVWCEAPELFDFYVSISGPPSSHFLEYPCSPFEVKPFMSILGANDNVLQDYDWEAQTWNIKIERGRSMLNSIVIGERSFLPYRVGYFCGAVVAVGDIDAQKKNGITTWAYCDGAIQLIRVDGAGHSMESIERQAGFNILQLIIDFMER